MHSKITNPRKAVALAVSGMLIATGLATVAVPQFLPSSENDDASSLPSANAADVGGTLDEKRAAAKAEALASFQFVETGLPKWNGGETSCYTSSNKTFSVDSPEDFAYALRYAPSYSGSTINILSDIDMNGSACNFQKAGAWTSVTFNGNGHTVYNFRTDYTDAQGRYNVGMCTTSSNCKISNITFSHMFLRGTEYIGLYPQCINLAANDVTFDGCFVYCYGDGRYHGMSAMMVGFVDNRYSGLSTFNRVGSHDCVSIGNSHAAATFGMYDGATFTDCFSDSDLVISDGGHGGCLAACSNRGNTFTRCWSNSTVYGNSDVGGFTGAANGDIYVDCFSSGVVEGNKSLGGFVSHMYASTAGATKATNCYTTASVGMNYAGDLIGGFASSLQNATVTRCYAAGEVGSVDTDLSESSNTGGFVGNCIAGISAVEWAYDMQSTGMKNKSIGIYGSNHRQTLLDCVRHDDGTITTTTYLPWLTGYSTNAFADGKEKFTSGYTYRHGLYPQIASMASHANPLFRAASAASVATVFCDTWADLPGSSAATFDTIRDIVRPVSFSSTSQFASNPSFSSAYVDDPSIFSITWSGDGSVSTIDKESPVLTLSGTSPYYATEMRPGIEWANVKASVKGDDGKVSVGTRRLRIIPTSYIEAGPDSQVRIERDEQGQNSTPPYDHKSGFSATCLDASTLSSQLKSGTAHPESALAFSAVKGQQFLDGTISGTMELPFNPDTKTLAASATLSNPDGSPTSMENLYDKLNGTVKFELADCGMYRLSYRTQLPDGRYLSASKSLAVTGGWSVTYRYNYDGLLAGNRISPDSVFEIQSGLEDFDGFSFAPFEAPPARDGWSFSYWSLDKEGKVPVSQRWFDDYTKNFGALTRDIDVYAQYNRLSPGTEVVLTMKPGIGTYGDKGISEDTMASGSPGDRIVISSATPPGRFVFEGWNANPLGGGMLEKAENSSSWVFTFGDEDAVLEAQYKQVRFDCDIRWIDKQTGEDIVEPARYELSDGDAFSFDLSAVDGELYAVDGASVTVFDAATGEELPAESVGLVLGDDGKYSVKCPTCDVRIDVSCDRLIQMPSTGEAGTLFLALFGSFLVAAAITLSARTLSRKGA